MRALPSFLGGLILGAALLAIPTLAGHGARAGSGTSKVAVLDLEKALYATSLGKEAEEKFNKLGEEKQAKLDKAKKSLLKYKTELEKQASVLKPEVLAKKQKELQDKLVALNDTYLQLEKELAGERAKLVKAALEQASPFIKDLAQAEGIDLIVDSGAVVWSSETVDLTDELTAKMK